MSICIECTFKLYSQHVKQILSWGVRVRIQLFQLKFLYNISCNKIPCNLSVNKPSLKGDLQNDDWSEQTNFVLLETKNCFKIYNSLKLFKIYF